MRQILRGPRVTLRPLDERDVDDQLRVVQDPELRRLTGTHRTFTRADIEAWVAGRGEAEGRYDWAVTETDGGGWLGDCALNDIDTDNGLPVVPKLEYAKILPKYFRGTIEKVEFDLGPTKLSAKDLQRIYLQRFATAVRN